MSLKWEELGFEIDDLKPKNSLNEFGDPKDDDLVKQVHKNHFEKKRWKRIKLLKQKFDKYLSHNIERRNAVVLQPEEVKLPETELRLPPIKESSNNIFSLTLMQANQAQDPPPKSERSLSPKSEKSEKSSLSRWLLENSYGLSSVDIQSRRKLAKIKAHESFSQKHNETLIKVNQKHDRKTHILTNIL